MQPVRAYVCRLCGVMFEDANKVVAHAKQDHAKELSSLKIESLKKDTSNDFASHVNLMEAIKEHTLKFLVDSTDTHGVFSIDEVLGSTEVHRLFQNAESCNWKNCRHEEPDPSQVDQILAARK